jgi:hypothetical protein
MAKTIMRAFRLAEISAVDRPAQAHARMAIMKRDEEPYWKRDFTTAQRDRAASSGAALPDGSFPIENKSDLHNAMQAIGRAKDPAKAKAHIRSRAKALGLEGELSDTFKSAGDPGPTGEQAMFAAIKKALGLADSATEAEVLAAIGKLAAADKDKSAAVKKALGLTETATEGEVLAAVVKAAAAEGKAKDTEIAKLKVDLEIAKAGMSDDEKAYHDGLKDDAEKSAFRSASKDERAARMKKRDDLPPHVKKALEENEDMKKRLARLEDDTALVGFTKQAKDAGLPEADGATIQKAYRGDKESVDKLVNYIKAANNASKASGLFKELGDGRTGQTLKAYDELMAKAEELRKKETGLTQAQAFTKVYADPANAELVKRERMESAPAAAA